MASMQMLYDLLAKRDGNDGPIIEHNYLFYSEKIPSVAVVGEETLRP